MFTFQELGRARGGEAKQMLDLERAKRLNRIAVQVAHDIRSPLAALDSVLTDVDELPERTRWLTRKAIQRIQEIAAELLETCREPDRIGVKKEVPPQLLSECVLELVNEKRARFRHRPDVEFRFEPSVASYGLFARILPGDLKRVLSNLLDNAVEAIEGRGVVAIDAWESGGEIALTVRDTGRGMTGEVLGRIGRRGITVDKAGGSGLGLAHAKECVERWGGSLAIESAVGSGTTVALRLPAVIPVAL